MTEETKRRMRLFLENPNHPDVKTREKLIKKIKTRDEFCCVVCSVTESKTKLCVHHRNMNRSDNRDENLVTLCLSCHQRLHRQKAKILREKYVFPLNDVVA